MSTQRAVTYSRVSGDDTRKDGRNLESQAQMCREYCAKMGYSVVAELAEDDKGASGASWDLPQLNKAIDMARAGDYDVLVARELDRLSRSLAKQLVVEDELQRAGVGVEYALAQYENSPEGQLTKQVRGVIAEYEKAKVTERMVRGRRNKAKSGQVLNECMMPYGYRLVRNDGHVTFGPRDDQAQIVASMFTWYVGGMSARDVARRLTETGVLTPGAARPEMNRPRKKPQDGWCVTTVRKILGNETYAGTWHYGDIAVPVAPIVSRSLWESAQVRKARNKAEARRNRKHPYLLAGRLRCGECQKRMNGKTIHGRQYYHCPASTNRLDYAHLCNATYHMGAGLLEQAVWERTRRWLLDPAQLRDGLDEYKAHKDAEAEPLRQRLMVIDEQLSRISAKLDRLLDLYVEGEIDKDKYKEAKYQSEKLRADLQNEHDALNAAIERQIMTQDRIDTILAFHNAVQQSIDKADDAPTSQQTLFDALDLEVVLTQENTERVAYIYCALGQDRVSIVNTHTSMLVHNTTFLIARIVLEAPSRRKAA